MGKRSCLACRGVYTGQHKPAGTVCTIRIILGWDYLIIRPSDWPRAAIIGGLFTYLIFA